MFSDKTELLTSILTEQEKEIFKRGGWGKQRGLGKRPCFLLIDAQYNYVGEDKPVLEQMGDWPSGCGDKAWKAVPILQNLIAKCRAKNIPVIYTRQVQKDLNVRVGFDSFGSKIARKATDMIDGAKGTTIITELTPNPGDLVIDKSYASALFGTPLIAWLVKMGIDTIFLAGGSTSGCVRCTAIDAAAHNFNVAVIMDCVFDRFTTSHNVALLDLWMKYADVINSQEAADAIDAYPMER